MSCYHSGNRQQDGGDTGVDPADPELEPDQVPDGSVCGNGILEEGEECDDGENNSDADPDACRTDCRASRCGDGVADSAEGCDGTDMGGETCESLGTVSIMTMAGISVSFFLTLPVIIAFPSLAVP